MSFASNLRDLRAQRNMSQEQLASLLGVSRQAISKWESGGAYPETDKLVMISDLFGCSLDDLVMSSIPTHAASFATHGTTGQVRVGTGIAQDITGYDEIARANALRSASASAVFCLSIGFFFLIRNLPASTASEMSIRTFLSLIVLFAGIVVGIGLLMMSAATSKNFERLHPYVVDFYTDEERSSANLWYARGMIIGLGLIFIGVVVDAGVALIAREYLSSYGAAATMLVLIAAGVWCIVYFKRMCSRTNIARYNERSKEADSRVSRLVGMVCGGIMSIGTIISLAMLFCGTFFDGWQNAQVLFWLPYPIGGACCVIALCVIRYLAVRKK